VYTASSVESVRHIVDRAFRTAIGCRAVAAIVLPKDVQEKKYVDPPHEHDTLHSSVGVARPEIVPNALDLSRAAEILNAGKKVAILAGAGCLQATGEVVAIAERLGAGVAKALLGKAAVPDDLPFVTGTMGLLGTLPSFEMMRQCDTLLMVGTCFPYAEFLPKEGQARGIQIDIDPRNLGLRYPTELNLVGDAALTLRALLPLLEEKSDRSWRERIQTWKSKWKEQDIARSQVSADPINPQLVFVKLSERLPDDAIVTGDAGTATNWYARNVELRAGMKGSLSGGLASMGSAVPYAIAAKFAFPNRVAVACTGDGAMQMNGSAELLTIAKYWKQWEDPRIVVLVLDNDDLNQVSWEMRVTNGNPKYEASQNLPRFDYARYAESLGFTGIRLERPEDVDGAWERAFASDRPVVIDAKVSADVTQFPPHISFAQAKNYFSALAKGDPNAGGIVKESIKGLIAGVTAR